MSIFDNLKQQVVATSATTATAQPVCSNCSDCSNAEYFEIAQNRLSFLAKELDYPLEDLLDWYQSPADMETLGTISMDDTRQYVTEYAKYLTTAVTRDLS